MRMRVRKPTRSKKPATGRMFERVTRMIRETSTRTMVIAVMSFVGAAMLIGAATSDVHQDKPSVPAQKPAAASTMPSFRRSQRETRRRRPRSRRPSRSPAASSGTTIPSV